MTLPQMQPTFSKSLSIGQGFALAGSPPVVGMQDCENVNGSWWSIVMPVYSKACLL